MQLILVLVCFVLTLYAGRLLELQAVRGQELAGTASSNRTETQVLQATRGTITDADGQPLAMTVQARNVTVDQTLIRDPEATAAALAPLLDASPETLAARLTGTKRFMYVAKAVTPQTWSQIADLGLAGVFSEPTTVRVYPAGQVAANVIGFVGQSGKGSGGLEYALDKELAGKDGERTYEGALSGRRIEIPAAGETTVDPVPGTDIRLTIDSDIQWVAQKAIADAVRQYDADSGDVVVMDPRTGHILALASVPTFDANKPAETVSADLGNRATGEIYEPGSTSKVMTVAAVLDAGAATPTTRVQVPPTLERGGKVFRDSSDHGAMDLTLTGVLAKSSNIGTILAAEKIGGQALYDTLVKFGVSRPTGLDFPGESNGLLPSPQDWSGTSFPTIAFGQGLAMTSVQVANVFATIANDGVRLTPSLVEGTVGADGSLTALTAGETGSGVRVIKSSTATTLRHMLENVVSSDGTAPLAAVPGYRVAGKTGTAQRFDANCGCYPPNSWISSFAGMAPADSPSLVVSVMLNNPNPNRGYYGGLVAGPVFKKVMSFALAHLGIPPTGTSAPTLPILWTPKINEAKKKAKATGPTTPADSGPSGKPGTPRARRSAAAGE